MLPEPWHKLYHALITPALHNTVTGFNVNLDRTIPVTRELLQNGPFVRRDMAEYRSRLIHSMEYATAEECFVEDQPRYQQFYGLFPGRSQLTIGGQAGIAAAHLTSSGVKKVLCAAGSMGRRTRDILQAAGVTILDFNTGCIDCKDIIHLVFEYQPGVVPVAEGVVPRNNRFIVSPAHEPASVLLPEDSMETFLDEISCCTHAFLSGYHYLHSDREFAAAADQVRRMKRSTGDLKVHTEWVTVTDNIITDLFVRHIIPETDSIGLNKHELELLCRFTNPGSSQPSETREPAPARLVRKALALCRATGLARVHVHTLGYYILILRKDAADPVGSRTALLFSSAEACRAARGSARSVSADGIRAVGDVAETFGDEISPGLFRSGNFFIVITPALIVSEISGTAGMGDRISSAAFAADPF